MTQLKPKKSRMVTMMTRNLQALEMAPFCMIRPCVHQSSAMDHQGASSHILRPDQAE